MALSQEWALETSLMVKLPRIVKCNSSKNSTRLSSQLMTKPTKKLSILLRLLTTIPRTSRHWQSPTLLRAQFLLDLSLRTRLFTNLDTNGKTFTETYLILTRRPQEKSHSPSLKKHAKSNRLVWLMIILKHPWFFYFHFILIRSYFFT